MLRNLLVSPDKNGLTVSLHENSPMRRMQARVLLIFIVKNKTKSMVYVEIKNEL